MIDLIAALALALSPAPVPHGGTGYRGPGDSVPPPVRQERDLRKEAREAIDAGDYARARRLLAELMVAEGLAEASRLTAAGDPFGAMTRLDEVLDLDVLDGDARGEALMLRGKAAFAAAASNPAKYSGLFGEAKENFLAAVPLGGGVAAALRASRASRMFGDGEGALDIARDAAGFINGGEGRAAGLDLDQPWSRTWAEAAFDAFVAAATDGKPVEESGALRSRLMDETRTALEQFIGDQPTESWGYLQMANLARWEQRPDHALIALEAGIGTNPKSADLHSAYIQLAGDMARADAQGRGLDPDSELDARYADILRRYAKFQSSFPRIGLLDWYMGYETFNHGVRKMGAGQDERETFDQAEESFRACAEKEPAYRDAAVELQAMCRVGKARSMQMVGEIEGAAKVLFTIDELRPKDDPAVAERGLTPAMEVSRDGMISPMTALSSLISGLLRDGSGDSTSMDLAASIAARIAALRPDDANHQNNAGFLHRDAAMLWEAQATRLLRRASDDGDRKRAAEARARAQSTMEASYEHYRRAAALAPDDVRVVNDAGLVMIYYLRTDPDAAEAYFLDSIKDGEAQLADPGAMAPVEVAQLTEAWGDAHENMGILEWTVRRNPEAALGWFQKAREIGPPSRAWMDRRLLPGLREWIDTGSRPEALDREEERRVWTHNPLPR